MMTRFLDTLNRVVSLLSIILFVLLFFVISLQVLSRYFLSGPFTWTEECSRFLFIWICFLGTSVAFRKRSHVTVDFFVNKFSVTCRNYIAVSVHTLTALFWVLLIIQGTHLAQRGVFLTAVTVPWLNWGHVYSAVPVSASIMLLYSLADLIKSLSGIDTLHKKTGKN